MHESLPSKNQNLHPAVFGMFSRPLASQGTGEILPAVFDHAEISFCYAAAGASAWLNFSHFKIWKKLTGSAPIFAAAGLIRPAPAELPQDRKIARVGGCSGAM